MWLPLLEISEFDGIFKKSLLATRFDGLDNEIIKLRKQTH